LCPGYYKKPYGQGLGIRLKAPVGRGTVETLIFGGVMVLGLCMGIVIISLLSMAQKGERIHDRMHCGEKIVTPPSPTSSDETWPQRDLKRINGGVLSTPDYKKLPLFGGMDLQETIWGK
jgi:hypothetical protein